MELLSGTYGTAPRTHMEFLLGTYGTAPRTHMELLLGTYRTQWTSVKKVDSHATDILVNCSAKRTGERYPSA
ncbi:hypothetical protein, partial [Paenibacillus odorifer]|uniref:hypothetical protein n=1 Tax=Paenibacillus odorifer TaxID=189426 RepID=UPI001C4C0E84